MKKNSGVTVNNYGPGSNHFVRELSNTNREFSNYEHVHLQGKPNSSESNSQQ